MSVMMLTASLVVEHNVGSPNLVRWDSNELNPVKLCRLPSELVVIPNLTEGKGKTVLPDSGFNHLLYILYCVLQTVLVTGDIPLLGNILKNIFILQAELSLIFYSSAK